MNIHSLMKITLKLAVSFSELYCSAKSMQTRM
nr:MAG TPA: hypothetical protein [Inoviridae sp.]